MIVNINTGIKSDYEYNHKKLQHFNVLVRTIIITFTKIYEYFGWTF